MERVKKPVQLEEQATPNGKVWWKNNGGTFRMGPNNQRIIKPGEKFQAYPEEISQAFRDVITPMQTLKEDNRPVKVAPSVYKLKESEEEEGLYDIVNAQGKPLNEKPLEKETAEQLIADLAR
jgi:hypothetical protein